MMQGASLSLRCAAYPARAAEMAILSDSSDLSPSDEARMRIYRHTLSPAAAAAATTTAEAAAAAAWRHVCAYVDTYNMEACMRIAAAAWRHVSA